MIHTIFEMKHTAKGTKFMLGLFALQSGLRHCSAQVLEAHSDEVWHVQFSHAGDCLASASKDCSAAIWRLHAGGAATLVHSLRAHERPLTYLAWSPDDSRLLTCGHDNVASPWAPSGS